MLGENTLVFTRNGFKKLKKLNKYDEIMTGYGTFAHVTELGPWVPMTKCVILSTGEKIYCTDDTLWNIGYNRTFKFTDEIDLDGDNSNLANIFEILGVRGRYVENTYEQAVVIPRYVPDKYILCDVKTRLEFLAGLIDSPMCELGSNEGIYVFYTYDEKFAQGLISLIRSLAFGVAYRKMGLVHVVRVYINKYVDALPIRDEYKASWDYSITTPPIKIVEIRDILPGEACFGRFVKVNGGFGLIGYSLVPVS